MIKPGTILLILFPLNFLFSHNNFAQEHVFADSLIKLNTIRLDSKPQIHYSLGSSFTYIPRYGSITGLTVSPYYRHPVSPKFSVEAGLIAGRYFPMMKNSSPESGINSPFNSLSVYGSAIYQLNQRLSIYGIGMKQLNAANPLYIMPSGSFSVGSTLNFGNFTIGAEIRVTDNSYYNSTNPFGGNRDFFPAYPW